MSNAPRIDSIEQTLDNSPRNSNKLINGNFDFWQRGTSQAFTSNAQFLADRWQISRSNNYPGSFEVTCSQGTPPTFAESGVSSNHSLRCEVTANPTTIPVDALMSITQKIEGYNARDMIGDKTVSYSFWFKTNVPGKYHITFFTSLVAYRYLQSFNISSGDASAENWVKIEGSIPMVDRDISEINTDENIGMSFSINLDSGSNFFGTDGEWNNAVVAASTGIPNWSGTIGNYAEFAQMMLHIGDTPQLYSLAGRNIQDELSMCQRYYEKSYNQGSAPGAIVPDGSKTLSTNGANNLNAIGAISFLTHKRSAPTVTIYNPVTGTTSSVRMSGSNFNVGVSTPGESGFRITNNTGAGWPTSASSGASFHYTADAEL